MSKIKSYFEDFINSDDYSMYFLEGSQEQQLEARKKALERFSERPSSLGYIESKKTLQKRLKASSNK
jgi:predicted PP-loop superfamily ATPase